MTVATATDWTSGKLVVRLTIDEAGGISAEGPWAAQATARALAAPAPDPESVLAWVFRGSDYLVVDVEESQGGTLEP